MDGNYIMKIIKQIFIFALSTTIFVGSMSSFVKTAKAERVFDIWYGIKPWEDVAGRLDDFLIALRNNPEMTGYVIFSVGENDTYKKAQSRIDRAVRHMVEYRKFDKRRLVIIYSGKSKEIITMLHIENKNTPTPRFDFSKDKVVTSKFKSLQ